MKFDEHKDSVFCVALVPREPYNIFVSGDCNDQAYIWKIVKEQPAPSSSEEKNTTVENSQEESKEV